MPPYKMKVKLTSDQIDELLAEVAEKYHTTKEDIIKQLQYPKPPESTCDDCDLNPPLCDSCIGA